MAKANFDPSDDRFTRGLIRRKVRQLMGRTGFTREDREDLEQELLARVLQSLPKFNPDKAHLNPFLTTVVERYVANLLRNRRAAKRDHQGMASLNVMIRVADVELTELAQTIGDRELDARLRRERRSEAEWAELAIDLAEVIAALPESWRTLLELRKTRSMREVAEEMNVPRTTLQSRMRNIRRQLEDTGLREYL